MLLVKFLTNIDFYFWSVRHRDMGFKSKMLRHQTINARKKGMCPLQ